MSDISFTAHGEALGSVVLDELVCPVVRVEMRAKAFVVFARVVGPVTARPEAVYDCTLHGSDGSVVMSGKIFTGWPKAREGDEIEFSFAAEPKNNTFGEGG